MEVYACPGRLVTSLKACIKRRDLLTGSRIHEHIIRAGLLQKNASLGSFLVGLYAKCGSLAKAQEVFDKLPSRDVITWNALITAYAQRGQAKQAVMMFDQMQLDGLSPSPITLVCTLKACGSTGAADKGKEIHAEIVRKGLLDKNVILGTALVNMYAKCGMLAKAQEVFDELPVRDAASWSVLMTGYTEHGQGEKALQCLARMQLEGLSPNAVTYACILKACASIGALEKGKEIHVEIVKEGLLKEDIVVGTALVDMYAKCGFLSKAQEVFDIFVDRDVVLWSALIAGYSQHGHGEQALKCYEQMQVEGVSPNMVTYVCTLKACGSIQAAGKGKEIHAEMIREGLLRKHILVGNALLDMYAKCGLLAKAQETFDGLLIRDTASCSALITGYTQHGQTEKALKFYQQMQLEGLSLSSNIHICILKACGSMGFADKGKEIHAQIVSEGLLKDDIILGTALVDMYAKSGMLGKAQEVFDNISARDVISWSALITGYVQHGYDEQAVMCFEKMQLEGLLPSAIIFSCIVKACGNIGAVDKAKEIHDEIVKEGLLEKDVVLGTALVDMYAKCGLLAKAQEVFDKLPVRNVVTWSVLMAGYALLGKSDHVFYLFDRMIEGVKPNLITFTIVLNACTHTGLVDKGQLYFESMSTDFGLIPALEHYTCMVDLFARAGHIVKAVAVIKKMPFAADLTVWLAVLGACQKRGNVELGELAFEHVMRLDEKEASAYICMINIYAATGRQEDADKVEALRIKNQAWMNRTQSTY